MKHEAVHPKSRREFLSARHPVSCLLSPEFHFSLASPQAICYCEKDFEGLAKISSSENHCVPVRTRRRTT